ncbi:MAG: EVE domain-containing protein [Bacteroidetes bacterium]|nr:EVE domain-containing protein [Bacteroidota bacterium]
MKTSRYWVAVVSREHAMRGIAGGFIQVCHGKQSPLKRISKGDGLLIYSPKLSMEGTDKYQKFTAIGKASDEDVYAFQMTEHFVPFRRNIQFMEAREVSILPLIGKLSFIQNKQSWGYPFRFGFFEIPENDFNLIASNMLVHEEV